MAELTKLEAKLGEVTGLAMAAQAATKKVSGLAKKEKAAAVLVKDLDRMHADARETEKRCSGLASSFTGKKTAILDEARTVKAKGAEMMATYLDEDSDALDGFEFLTMAEAGEVGHWSVLKTLNETAGRSDIAALVAWALPIQEGHLKGAMAGSVMLASNDDPNAPA